MLKFPIAAKFFKRAFLWLAKMSFVRIISHLYEATANILGADLVISNRGQMNYDCTSVGKGVRAFFCQWRNEAKSSQMRLGLLQLLWFVTGLASRTGLWFCSCFMCFPMSVSQLATTQIWWLTRASCEGKKLKLDSRL
ncbi:hypothetical protein AVEN_132182-1 [Araneus ventricosus]|uniref:Uncharacterized protein n=1 Tax=Araneus ventricosus TaxID=182803 RepID=A0A4Y2P4H5_ARAVE|nr:hypothetical protein AVEN_132182-1 [Araneus ventricosus]